MQIIIIAGFLGSGKTTILLRLAHFLSQKLSPENIVIIENEIGTANVDGILMSQTAYEVRDLTAGCICCTLSGQLINALEEIRRDINPQWLLVEATGIANQTIADVISQSSPTLKTFSLTLVDAERWDELMEKLPMLIGTQLEKADFILINKIETLALEDLDRVETEVREFNNQAPCYRISADPEDFSVVRKVAAHAQP